MINGGRRFFSVLLTIIIIIVILLSSYLAYNYISNYLIAKDASKTVDEFENQIIVVGIDDDSKEEIANETQTINGSTNGSAQASVQYQGYNVIGTIQIPKTKVKYPIVDSISTDAMDKAIVMLYGPGLNQIGNTVIVGHNYRNGGFFGNNKKLELGDKIYITDGYGNKIEYTITNKYYTTDSDFEYASRKTNGKREISLSTCTSDTSKRLIIWAKEV